MSERYSGKRVVITGGTRGVGRAAARTLIDGGAKVIVTGRDQAALDAARTDLGDQLIAVRSDAASLDSIDELASRVADGLGRVDLLFANAGISHNDALEEESGDDYDEVMAINARGPYFTVQKLAPLLADGGAVVLTTSVVNVKGLPDSSVYAASKAALRSMTRTLAQELLPRHVRVNAVSPGPIDSGILERMVPEGALAQTRAQMEQSNPMGRFGRMDEVVAAALFLAFEATFTTGAELPVDGGLSQLL